MAFEVSGPVPFDRCGEDVYANGREFGIIEGRDRFAMNSLCNRINAILSERGRVDWHYIAGRPLLLYVGEHEEIEKAYDRVLAYE